LPGRFQVLGRDIDAYWVSGSAHLIWALLISEALIGREGAGKNCVVLSSSDVVSVDFLHVLFPLQILISNLLVNNQVSEAGSEIAGQGLLISELFGVSFM
jgi:hypothetical protein